MALDISISFDSFYNIIGGQKRGAERTYCGTNPANKKPLWNAPVATSKDVEDAIAASREAFPSWTATEYRARAQMLQNFADLYLEYVPQFAELLVAETGRTVRNEVHVEWKYGPNLDRCPEAKYETMSI